MLCCYRSTESILLHSCMRPPPHGVGGDSVGKLEKAQTKPIKMDMSLGWLHADANASEQHLSCSEEC